VFGVPKRVAQAKKDVTEISLLNAFPMDFFILSPRKPMKERFHLKPLGKHCYPVTRSMHFNNFSQTNQQNSFYVYRKIVGK
jgi:hypothetical protein